MTGAVKHLAEYDTEPRFEATVVSTERLTPETVRVSAFEPKSAHCESTTVQIVCPQCTEMAAKEQAVRLSDKTSSSLEEVVLGHL